MDTRDQVPVVDGAVGDPNDRRMTGLRYLSFDSSEVDADICCLEAMASTAAAEHAAVMAEVGQVLDWAWRSYPHTQGCVDDGIDWDHDLALVVEAGGWHTVSLTLAATPAPTEMCVDLLRQPQAAPGGSRLGARARTARPLFPVESIS